MARWGKECRCGNRRIPKDWPRCGECAEARSRVEFAHNTEPGYRDKRTLRHQLVAALTKLRQAQPEDVTVDHIVDQAQILHTKAERRRKLAERLPEILVDWGNEK